MLKLLYKKSYKNLEGDITPRVNASLLQFLNQKASLVPKKNLTSLEVGVGKKSVLLNSSFSESLENICFLDFENTALSFLKESLPLSIVNKSSFLLQDALCLNDINKYDLILDAHLFHCLIGVEAQKLYLQKISDALCSGGLFFLESMISHSELNFSSGYTFDQEAGVLSHSKTPIRTIRQAFDIEEVILSLNLEIKYFSVIKEMSFIVDSGHENALPTDPHVLRCICMKK